MTYYADLTPYSYLPETLVEGTVIRNVGWLDAEHTYPTGNAPTGFVAHLGALCRDHPVARTRGMHWCELCAEGESDYPVIEDIDGTPVSLGSAEVRVEDQLGGILAAPDLVYHYVVKHGYLPPEPFVEAVLARRTAG